MAGWDKLLDAKQMGQLYVYVRARADKVLPPGRPDEVGPNKGKWEPARLDASLVGAGFVGAGFSRPRRGRPRTRLSRSGDAQPRERRRIGSQVACTWLKSTLLEIVGDQAGVVVWRQAARVVLRHRGRHDGEEIPQRPVTPLRTQTCGLVFDGVTGGTRLTELLRAPSRLGAAEYAVQRRRSPSATPDAACGTTAAAAAATPDDDIDTGAGRTRDDCICTGLTPKTPTPLLCLPRASRSSVDRRTSSAPCGHRQ